MSNYVKTKDFAAADALATGTPAKAIKGTDLGLEFDNIATAVATKYDPSNLFSIVPTWTGIHTYSAKPAFNAGAAFTAGAGTTVTVSGTAGAGNAAIAYTNAPLFQSTSGIIGLALNSVGTNFGLIQNDGNNTWSLASGNVLNALGTPVLQWTSAQASVRDGGGTLQAIGFLDLPLNSINTGTGYTLQLSDRGKMIRVNGVAGQTVTIPANASVAFPDGSAIVIVNNTAGTLSVAITSDTLFLAGTATTGTRTIAANGICTITKAYAATQWAASGAGVS